MNISYNQDLLCNIIPLLKNFKYHIISHRELLRVLDSLPGEREFWVYTCDAHLQMAVISWCMVFGTDNNPSHWKNLAHGNVISLKEYIAKKTQISISEYEVKWGAIVEFRNHYVAHKEDYTKPVPFLTFAEMVVDNFELWAIEMFHPEKLEQNAPLNYLWEACIQDIKTSIDYIITRD